MNTCTWENCHNVASHPQIGQDKEKWADLCDVHAKEMDDSLLDAKAVLRCWIKAQGGTKGAMKRMQPAIDSTVKLAEFLTKHQRRKRT